MLAYARSVIWRWKDSHVRKAREKKRGNKAMTRVAVVRI
mgnify:CR=1 FL=1